MEKMRRQLERYAKCHPQDVVLVWLDKSRTVHPAEEAVKLCLDLETSRNIFAVQAKDKHLEGLLNTALDDLEDD